MRAVIHSKKHYFQRSLLTVLSGQSEAILFAQAVEAPASALAIEEGSSLKAVFVEMWVRTNDTSAGTALISLIKTTDGQVPLFADMIDLHNYNNKKNVLYHTQGLTNINTENATPFVRQWFKIPKGKQRFGAGDRLYLVVTAQALDQNICGFMTYKEYS